MTINSTASSLSEVFREFVLETKIVNVLFRYLNGWVWKPETSLGRIRGSKLEETRGGGRG